MMTPALRAHSDRAVAPARPKAANGPDSGATSTARITGARAFRTGAPRAGRYTHADAIVSPEYPHRPFRKAVTGAGPHLGQNSSRNCDTFDGFGMTSSRHQRREGDDSTSDVSSKEVVTTITTT